VHKREENLEIIMWAGRSSSSKKEELCGVNKMRRGKLNIRKKRKKERKSARSEER